MARPSKPYRASWGEEIHGLNYNPKSRRYRILATDEKYREPDERRAVQRFRDATANKVAVAFTETDPQKLGCTTLAAIEPVKTFNGEHLGAAGAMVIDEAIEAAKALDIRPASAVIAGYAIPEQPLWNYFRMELVADPVRAANLSGLPELAGWKHLNIPKQPAKLADLLKTYLTFSDAGEKQITKVKKSWNMMTKELAATTTEEITENKLIDFREKLKTNQKYSAKTRQLIVQRLKAVVNIAAKNKFAERVVRLKTQMKALEMPQSVSEAKAAPMSVQTFRTLIGHSTTDAKIRAALLLALNTASYAAEVTSIKWKEIDLERRTYVARRGKTSVIRAAVLWPETIEAVKKLPVAGEYVLLSQHGTKYHVESFRKLYVAHCRRCGFTVPLDADKQFSSMRDAAYTTGSRNKDILTQVMVLAGHKIGGKSDHYIGKNPEFVSDACDAIRRHYIMGVEADATQSI